MERRKFLIGTGALAAGGAAALGSGAFSRVQSQREVSIQVARDDRAYLGLKPLDTPNSNNFVDYDNEGHLVIDVGEHNDAANAERDVNQSALGVNSDSFTWFDGMFEICNQGKADATISYELPEGVPENTYQDQPENDPDTRPDNRDATEVPTVAFYFKRDEDTRVILEPGNETDLALGECEEVGLRTVTKGIDANGPDDEQLTQTLVDGDVVITADSPAAGDPSGSGSGGT